MATPEVKHALTALPGKRVEVPIKKATGPGDNKNMLLELNIE